MADNREHAAALRGRLLAMDEAERCDLWSAMDTYYSQRGSLAGVRQILAIIFPEPEREGG